MEIIAGILTVMPPILVVVLAIKTKNVLISLLTGVIVGLIIMVSRMGVGLWEGARLVVPTGVDLMTGVLIDEGNVHLLVFLILLGALIAIFVASGCATAFSDLAVSRIKNPAMAQIATLLLGIVIFIDDYFNAITVGNVMVPITDRFKISRAKLAYIIDSTSAPVTILMPISSWVATVISLAVPAMAAYGFSESGMSVFIRSVPFDLYAWLTLVMVMLVALRGFNIGPMARFEKEAAAGNDISVFVDVNESVIDDIGEGHRGKASDLILLIVLLVVLSILFMLANGGFFSGEASLRDAFMECDSMLALVYGVLAVLAVAFVLFLGLRGMKLAQFDAAFLQGVKSMMTPICILTLSWTLSEILGDGGIGTGRYVATLVGGWLPYWLLPAIIFIITAFISFTTGASWGAMAIMVPTSIAICSAVHPDYLHIVIGAALAGCIFGDHCSPVSDTTVLSSAGAGCRHLDHVMSQLPYAFIVAGICTIGYILAGLTNSALLSLAVGLVLCFGVTFLPESFFIKIGLIKREKE